MTGCGSQPIDASSRSAPYNCDFGGKWLQIQAIVQVTDREGRTFETITPETIKNATKVSETDLQMEMDDSGPVTKLR